MLFNWGNRNERELNREQSHSQTEESRGNLDKAKLAEERAQTAAQRQNSDLLAEQNDNLNLLQAQQAATNAFLKDLEHSNSRINKTIENTNALLADQRKIFQAGFQRSAENQLVLIDNTNTLVAGQELQIDMAEKTFRAQFSTWRISFPEGKQFNQWSKTARQSMRIIEQRTDAMKHARVQDFLRIARDNINDYPELVDPAVLNPKMEAEPKCPVAKKSGKIPKASPDLLSYPSYNPRGWHPKMPIFYKRRFLMGLLALVAFLILVTASSIRAGFNSSPCLFFS